MILQYITWDPPLGIPLGSFTIRFYSICFIIAFLMGYRFTKKIYVFEKLNVELLDKLFMYTVIATLLGARLGHVFFYDWAYYKNHLGEILLPIQFSPFKFTGFQGLASHGAAISIILMMWYYSKKILKKPVLWILDRIVIAITFGGIFVRLGNLMNSEIIGKVTDLPWAFIFKNARGIPNPLLPRHPSQLYEALGYFIVFLILHYVYWKTEKRKQTGFIFGLFLVLLWGGVRFMIEFVKENQKSFEEGMLLNMGQILSIPFVLAGIYLMIKSKNKISK